MVGINSISLIGWGISFVAGTVIVVTLIKAYLKNRSLILGYFTAFLITRYTFFWGLLLAWLIWISTQNLVADGIVFSIIWVAAFISFIFPALIFSQTLRFSKIKKFSYVGFLILLAVVTIIWIWVNFTPASYLPDAGYLIHSPPDIAVKIFYPIGKLVGVAPLGFLFLYYAIKSTTPQVRKRSLLIGIGLLWVVSTLIVPSLLPQPWMMGIYCCIGDILICIGVLIRPTTQQELVSKGEQI